MRICINPSVLHGKSDTGKNTGPWKSKYLVNAENFKHNFLGGPLMKEGKLMASGG